jgi:hypothetical protein
MNAHAPAALRQGASGGQTGETCAHDFGRPLRAHAEATRDVNAVVQTGDRVL